MNLANQIRMSGILAGAAPPDPGNQLTSGPGTTVGSDYAFAPLIRQRQLLRTTLVPQGDDFIDLQTEVAIPSSPTVTQWVVTGDDIAWFDLTDGRLFLKAATRTSISKPAQFTVTVKGTNAYGSSQDFLVVDVPADSDCRFAAYGSGSDSNNGTTPALAWKRVPGATGFTGSGVTLGAGKVLFLKAERHPYQLAASGLSLDHAGTSAGQMTYQFNGWGGRAIVSGDDPVTGWTSVTQAEVGGNANHASIRKLDLTAGSNGGAIAAYQHLFDDDVMLYPAQSPTPADLWDFEDPNDVTEQKGMWRATISTSTGVSPRISQAGGAGTLVTIVDPRVAAVFGANTPLYVTVWGPGNEVTRCPVTSYTQGTSTVTFTLNPGAINSSSSSCAYSFTHHACQIVEVGQFAISPDGATLYAWLPNNGVTSVARRQFGVVSGKSYVTIDGGEFRRFVSNSTGVGGSAWGPGNGSAITNLTLRDMRISQCRADGGNGLLHSSGGALTDPVIERNAFLDHNPHASGIRIGAKMTGYSNGTPTQVRGNARGKVRWNYSASAAIQRTFMYSANGNGMHYYENCARDLKTVHGNCISLYSDQAGTENAFNVVELNFFDNCVRGYTVSTGFPATDRFNLVTRNVFTGNETGLVVALYNGDPGSTFSRNLVMGATGWSYSGGALYIDEGQRMTASNNVAAGIGWDAPNLATAVYSVTDNLVTVNQAPPNLDANRVSTGNTVATGAPIEVWNGTFTSQMQSTLGAGQIGLFWTIA